MPKVTRGMGSSRDPQVAREWVVTHPPTSCAPGARSSLKAEPGAPGDPHQLVTPKGTRQTRGCSARGNKPCAGAGGPGLSGLGALGRARQAQHGCTHCSAAQLGARGAPRYELEIKHDPSSSEAVSSAGPNKTGHFRNL